MHRVEATHPRRCGGGFTLLEAMIALVIMALTVTALSMAIGSGRQHATEAVDQMEGALAAEAMLAEVTALDYASLDTYNGRDRLCSRWARSRRYETASRTSVVFPDPR